LEIFVIIAVWTFLQSQNLGRITQVCGQLVIPKTKL